MLLLAALRLLLKDWRASALIVSAVLVLFYTYGRLVASLGGSLAAGVIVAVTYLAILAVTCLFAVKKRGKLQRPTAITNVVAVSLAAMTLVTIVTNAVSTEPRPAASRYLLHHPRRVREQQLARGVLRLQQQRVHRSPRGEGFLPGFREPQQLHADTPFARLVAEPRIHKLPLGGRGNKFAKGGSAERDDRGQLPGVVPEVDGV